MKECTILDDLIENICKISSDIVGVVPASISPVSIPPTSIHTATNETVSKEDLKVRK